LDFNTNRIRFRFSVSIDSGLAISCCLKTGVIEYASHMECVMQQKQKHISPKASNSLTVSCAHRKKELYDLQSSVGLNDCTSS